MSSIEEKKYLCLIKLSYDISLNVTRAYTETNVLSKYDNQVSTFLKINKHDIFHLWKDTPCCQCISGGSINLKATSTLTFRQIERLFEFQGNGTPGHFRKDRTNNNVIQHCLCRMSERSVSLNDFDINLLETLLKRFVNLESDVKMWLSTIRETRNHIAHVTSTTDFDPGRLDKWWKMLEGSILGLVKKIQPAFYAKSIESQINILKNSNLEAIYGKKLMDDVNAENKILLEDLAERNDTRIVECENNIKQAILENNNELKQHIAEVNGDFMRKLEELEAMVKGSAKEDPNTNLRSELDSTRKIHVACQVEADDIDEHLTIKNLSNPDKVAANQSDDKDFKIVDVKQKCILLELTASPEILSSEECLLNAIDQLINQVVLAGDLDTRVPGKMTLNLSFTSPLSREELDVFSRVFRTTDKTEIIDSDVMNQIQDYSFGTITRETQTEITTEDNACQVDMMCKWCATNDHHSNQFWDDCLINSNESSLAEGSPAEFPVIPWNIGADVLPVDTYTTEREFQHEYYLGDSFYIDGIIKDVKILDKNKIIIASYEKKQLVVFELNNCIEMHIPLREDPSKLAVINPNTVAIIMRCVNYVLIFDITERVPLNSLYIGSTCCGIAYLNKRLYVGCKDETIKVLSLDGEIKVMIEVQDTEIHNICVSKTQNLYCTNYLNDKLICIDTNSERVNSIHNSRLQRPRGITMDENDNIVVACHRSTEILRLSYDGKQATKIMDTETFNGFPCICCDLETGSLIIGGYDTVFVYRKNRNLKI